MDIVIFETSRGKQFTLEIWFFDTVLAIKEKIERQEGVPVARQTLLFNGHVMADDADTALCRLLEGSRIQLVVDDDPPGPAAAARVRLSVGIAASKRRLSVECDAAADTVGRLKERIQASEGIPVGRLALFSAGGVELQEGRTLAECGLAADGAEVSVAIRPFPSAGAAKGRRLKVTVVPPPESGAKKKKVVVEVSPSDQVRELRKELQRLQHGHRRFDLPPEGSYFFIYRQALMEEDKTFRWHDVEHGDTIEIFNCSVDAAGS